MPDHVTTAEEEPDERAPGLLVVDAANVVGARPDGWWRDRAGAARRLVEAVSTAHILAEEVVVVLEGAARAGVPESDVGRVRVVHAGGSGDDEIAALVAEAAESGAARTIVVVTSDRGLRERVQRYARTQGPRWLWRQLRSGQ